MTMKSTREVLGYSLICSLSRWHRWLFCLICTACLTQAFQCAQSLESMVACWRWHSCSQAHAGNKLMFINWERWFHSISAQCAPRAFNGWDSMSGRRARNHFRHPHRRSNETTPSPLLIPPSPPPLPPSLLSFYFFLHLLSSSLSSFSFSFSSSSSSSSSYQFLVACSDSIRHRVGPSVRRSVGRSVTHLLLCLFGHQWVCLSHFYSPSYLFTSCSRNFL